MPGRTSSSPKPCSPSRATWSSGSDAGPTYHDHGDPRESSVALTEAMAASARSGVSAARSTPLNAATGTPVTAHRTSPSSCTSAPPRSATVRNSAHWLASSAWTTAAWASGATTP